MAMDMAGVKKILIVNTFGIGDVLFTTPLIRNIKKQIPGVVLGYVANARTVEILKNWSLIDQIYVYERDEFHEAYHRSRKDFLKKTKNLLDEIKTQHYDVALDLSMNMSTGFLMMIAGIVRRIGFDYKGRGRFLTQRIAFRGYEGKHVIEFYLDLLKEIGLKPEALAMEFPMTAQDIKWAEEMFQRDQAGGDVVVIVPGGGASWGRDAVRKQWPAQRFAALADRLVESCGQKIVFSGGPADKPLSQKIAGMMRTSAVDVTGELSLGQSAALFAKSRLVVANDGGPLHMAVACGAKTVSIFGPVDENVYGPYPRSDHSVVTSDVLCRPCYRRFRVAQCDHISCLRNLPVEKVFKAVEQSL